MITLLPFLLFSQVTYHQEAPIRLDLAYFEFEKVTVTKKNILVIADKEEVVHVFGLDGSYQTKLGEDSQVIQLPQNTSWLDEKEQVLVYDAAKRFFSLWDDSGGLIEEKKTDFDMFFEVGKMLPLQDGYVAPVSLTKDGHLLAHFNPEFAITSFAYELMSPKLSEMSTVVRQSFASQAIINGRSIVLAAQSLSPKLHFFDADLKPTGSMVLEAKRWRKANLKRLEKVSKNPKELRKLQASFSEVVGLETISGSMFLVGFRNLKGSDYSYQCYEARARIQIGPSFDGPYKLVGAYGKRIYLIDPNAATMTLTPCLVQR